MEALTTGSTTSAPPNERLAQYYAWLENEWGFIRQEISTDFQFNSVDETVAHMAFFFPDLATTIRSKAGQGCQSGRESGAKMYESYTFTKS